MPRFGQINPDFSPKLSEAISPSGPQLVDGDIPASDQEKEPSVQILGPSTHGASAAQYSFEPSGSL